ncbi:hypothetical protein CHUAL_001646 [Chamberlinius hualienensis]
MNQFQGQGRILEKLKEVEEAGEVISQTHVAYKIISELPPAYQVPLKHHAKDEGKAGSKKTKGYPRSVNQSVMMYPNSDVLEATKHVRFEEAARYQCNGPRDSDFIVRFGNDSSDDSDDDFA